MKLYELLNHFEDKSIRCDICSPILRTIDSILEIEKNEFLLKQTVSAWRLKKNVLEVEL